MAVKLVGSMMILIAASIIGMTLAKIKIDRVRQLRAFIAAFNMLETEIRFSLSFLPDTMVKIAAVTEKRVGEVFAGTAAFITDSKMNACNAWGAALAQNAADLCLNKEDHDILLTFGGSLGEMDAESQIKNIKLVVEQLKHQELNADEDRQKGEKLFRNLGVLCGLAAVIIIF